jgi:hypothetical protein
MIPSLQDIAIKTLIKNDIAVNDQYHLVVRLIAEFCENHPEQTDSPRSYWKLRGSYKFLSERTVDAVYKGPGDLFGTTFLDDATNLTTKFINSELNKYVNFDNVYFVPREISHRMIPYKAYFEFTPEYIKQTGSKYAELGLETTVLQTTCVKRCGIIKNLCYHHSYHFKNNVYADYMYNYKPITYICEKEHVPSVLHSISVFVEYKNRPVFLFNNELKFVDEYIELQRDCQDILTRVLERIKWFRTTIHAKYMSELHFMLLDCDVTHRVLNMITLYPRVIFKDDDIKDESPDEVPRDEA